MDVEVWMHIDASSTNKWPTGVAKCCEPRTDRSDGSGRSWLEGKLSSQGTPCGVGASVPQQLAPHRAKPQKKQLHAALGLSSLHDQPAIILPIYIYHWHSMPPRHSWCKPGHPGRTLQHTGSLPGFVDVVDATGSVAS